jgi:hypothetical protein
MAVKRKRVEEEIGVLSLGLQVPLRRQQSRENKRLGRDA